MSTCRVCTAPIVWCETAEGTRVPLDEHEPQMNGPDRYRIVENRSPRPLIEPIAEDFPAEAMVDHRKLCRQPRAT